MTAASSDFSTSIFITKSSGKASAQKSKVVKKECIIRVSSTDTDQIINASLINESTVSLIHGSIYSMKRSQNKLLDDSGKVIKEILLGTKDEGKISTASKKNNNDQYQVMGIEEEGNARVNKIIATTEQMRQLVP